MQEKHGVREYKGIYNILMFYDFLPPKTNNLLTARDKPIFI